MKRLVEVLSKKDRSIIGVMSGTSLDGVDIALINFKGTGSDVTIKPQHFRSYEIPAEWRKRIQDSFYADTEEVCRINYDLGDYFAELIQKFCNETKTLQKDIDAIGLHGQTIFHVHDHSTLQVGEAEIVAQRLNSIVVSDFRSGDIAAGGCGAPLVPYFDNVIFGDKSKNVALLNLGGMANITYLPKDNSKIIAFDTGPANAILNEIVEIITDGKSHFDQDGIFSKKGDIIDDLLMFLMEDEYFKKPPPKSTGREDFGAEFVNKVINEFPQVDHYDLLRTFVELIVKSIKTSCELYLNDIERLIVSGGGSNHPLIMSGLREAFGEDTVVRIDEISEITSDSKEAVAFALLAHEKLNNTPTNIPSVTGAKKTVSLGKLTVPG